MWFFFPTGDFIVHLGPFVYCISEKPWQPYSSPFPLPSMFLLPSVWYSPLQSTFHLFFSHYMWKYTYVSSFFFKVKENKNGKMVFDLINCEIPSLRFLFLNSHWHVTCSFTWLARKCWCDARRWAIAGKQSKRTLLRSADVWLCAEKCRLPSRYGVQLHLNWSLSTNKVSGSGGQEHLSPSSESGFVLFLRLLQACRVTWLFDACETQKAVTKRKKDRDQLEWDTEGTSFVLEGDLEQLQKFVLLQSSSPRHRHPRLGTPGCVWRCFELPLWPWAKHFTSVWTPIPSYVKWSTIAWYISLQRAFQWYYSVSRLNSNTGNDFASFLLLPPYIRF